MYPPSFITCGKKKQKNQKHLLVKLGALNDVKKWNGM